MCSSILWHVYVLSMYRMVTLLYRTVSAVRVVYVYNARCSA